jgi:hypothetical protein
MSTPLIGSIRPDEIDLSVAGVRDLTRDRDGPGQRRTEQQADDRHKPKKQPGSRRTACPAHVIPSFAAIVAPRGSSQQRRRHHRAMKAYC